MRKISVFFDALRTSVLCMVLLTSACMVGFTSCGDDEEEEETGGMSFVEGVSYPGIWVMTYIKIVEDGETDEGTVTPESGEVRLTLLENGTYTYYALTKGDTDEEDELIEERGQWSYSGNILTLTHEEYGYTVVAKMTVRSWTSTSLVTYQEENDEEEGYFYSETRTWVKR